MIYIENIKNALADVAPNSADIFEFNYELYKQQINDLHDSIQVAIQTIPVEKRILITSHDAFQYFGKRYGLELEAILGTSTDAEAQTSDIQRINTVIQKNGVPAVFVESTINPKLLEQIARDNEVKIGGKLYSDSLGDKDSPANSYIDMLKHNA